MNIVFITTNQIWSGSEELWYHTTLSLIQKNVNVSVAVNYSHVNLELLKKKNVKILNVNDSFGFFHHLLFKLIGKALSPHRRLIKFLKYRRPSLVVISQGSNVEALTIMMICKELNIPYLTVTHLVCEVHLLNINSFNLQSFIDSYDSAVKNYFVSNNNLRLHELFLGYTSKNSEIIYNPFRLEKRDLSYPGVENGFNLAFVGRIEFFHKGIDLLIQVISSSKWQNRNITFNFYGSGPHEELLEKNIKKLNLNNVKAHGFTEDVLSIWQKNHACILTSRMEGQPLSLIEAMMCKRICIVTDVGGVSDIIDNNETGFIATNPSIISIDDVLERAWEKRFEWHDMGEKARMHFLKNTPNDPVDYFISKIEQAVNSSN